MLVENSPHRERQLMASPDTSRQSTTLVIVPIQFRGFVEPRLPGQAAGKWYGSEVEALSMVADANVFWSDHSDPAFLQRVVSASRKLAWVTTHSSGINTYPLEELRKRNIRLTNGRGVSAIPVAEFAVLGMLAAAKNFSRYIDAKQKHEWLDQPAGRGELWGTRALIIGYGAIGQEIGKRLASFGVSVIGVRRHGDPQNNILGPDEWISRIHEFDWIVMATPLTEASQHLIGKDQLGRMKSTAWLINVARGGLVDQAELIRALSERRIAGAVLDVTDPEPLAADHPLWAAPNVLVTSHMAGKSASHMEERAGQMFLDNLDRFLSQRPLMNEVDLNADN